MFAYAPFQATGHFYNDIITGFMAVEVVGLFETVKVKEADMQLGFIAHGTMRLHIGQIKKELPAWNPAQVIKKAFCDIEKAHLNVFSEPCCTDVKSSTRMPASAPATALSDPSSSSFFNSF